MEKISYLSDRVVRYRRNLLISSFILALSAVHHDPGLALRFVDAEQVLDLGVVPVLLMLVQTYLFCQFIFPAFAEREAYLRSVKIEGGEGQCQYAKTAMQMELWLPIVFGAGALLMTMVTVLVNLG